MWKENNFQPRSSRAMTRHAANQEDRRDYGQSGGSMIIKIFPTATDYNCQPHPHLQSKLATRPQIQRLPTVNVLVAINPHFKTF